MVRSSGSQYAAAGTAPPGPPFLRGGSGGNTTGGKVPLLGSRVFNRPPWPPLLKGGKLRETFAAGNLGSLFCTFSSRRPGPPF